LFPKRSEGGIERAGVETQTDSSGNERIMVSDTLRQVDQRSGGVEKDRFVHGGNNRTGRRLALFRFSRQGASYYQTAMFARAEK
jgi:hypothetical protein